MLTGVRSHGSVSSNAKATGQVQSNGRLTEASRAPRSTGSAPPWAGALRLGLQGRLSLPSGDPPGRAAADGRRARGRAAFTPSQLRRRRVLSGGHREAGTGQVSRRPPRAASPPAPSRPAHPAPPHTPSHKCRSHANVCAPESAYPARIRRNTVPWYLGKTL